jgi:hypothetical protein
MDFKSRIQPIRAEMVESQEFDNPAPVWFQRVVLLSAPGSVAPACWMVVSVGAQSKGRAHAKVGPDGTTQLVAPMLSSVLEAGGL